MTEKRGRGALPGPQVDSCADVPIPDYVRGNAMRGAYRKGYLLGLAHGPDGAVAAMKENPYPEREKGQIARFPHAMRKMCNAGIVAGAIAAARLTPR